MSHKDKGYCPCVFCIDIRNEFRNFKSEKDHIPKTVDEISLESMIEKEQEELDRG